MKLVREQEPRKKLEEAAQCLKAYTVTHDGLQVHVTRATLGLSRGIAEATIPPEAHPWGSRVSGL